MRGRMLPHIYQRRHQLGSDEQRSQRALRLVQDSQGVGEHQRRRVCVHAMAAYPDARRGCRRTKSVPYQQGELLQYICVRSVVFEQAVVEPGESFSPTCSEDVDWYFSTAVSCDQLLLAPPPLLAHLQELG